jgi:HK97 family phage major capsid protein
MKMNETRIQEIETRIAELDGVIEQSQSIEEIRAVGEEKKTLREERDIIIEKRIQTLQDINAGKVEVRTIQKPEEALKVENRELEMKQALEQRGEDLKKGKSVSFAVEELKELRAITIASSDLVVEKKYSTTLNDSFGEVSGTIDVVNAVVLNGGESYRKGFVKGYGEADYTTETGNYFETDPEFDYVDINKVKITAYTEITDEALKLPNVQYQAYVAQNIQTAIRKKISKMILTGTGTNSFVGIFNAPTNVLPTASDLGVSAIDADTLDDIVFAYGGDEEVEGTATLFLSKADLAAFAAIRDNEGRKLFTINPRGNTGTISSAGSFNVPYIINSAAPALSASATANNTYCMAYGVPVNYEMPIFSNLTVEESRDYKFRTGQVAYRASIWAGGNVAAHKGFVRVKKVAAT